MQVLFYMDMRQCFSSDLLEAYFNNFNSPEDLRAYAAKLVKGVVGNRNEIDPIIERYSDNWKVSRMACVDRNVLRVAVFEIMICDDIPFKVAINEAIDIGKKFGTEESGAFINGILDSIRMALEKGEIEAGKQFRP